MIIDSHVHFGKSDIFEVEVKESDLIKTMTNNKVDICLVQPLPVNSLDYKKIHNDIYKLSKKYPNKIFGVINFNPRITKKEIIYEVNRCIKDLGFIGLKLHTFGYAISPLSEKADLIFKLATELKVPLIIHTGNGMPFSSPSLSIVKANNYPELKIILAHSGTGFLVNEAYVAARECKNIFLETSWLSAEDTEMLIKSLGSEKIMMGSDIFNGSCYNQAMELKKYEILNISENDKINCLFRTAKEVFGLNL